MPKDGQQLPEGGRVAVVVPSYNHAPFVAAALRSVFAQTHAPARLLVIDDGSRDGSPRVIEDVLKDCPFPCELIARENRGLCATLNEGLAKTEGAYFAYLGSDDLWLPGFLEARVVLLEETYAPMSPTVVHRRQGLERHGWNERARLEDYELYLKLSADGDFAFDPRVLSAWRRHGTNTSGDFVWMIEARLEAQRNAAPHLDLSPGQLARYQRVLNFAGAEDLLRLGDKRAALKYLRRGLSGAPSAASLARVALRLVTPYSLVRRRNRSKQTSAARRYGEMMNDG